VEGVKRAAARLGPRFSPLMAPPPRCDCGGCPRAPGMLHLRYGVQYVCLRSSMTCICDTLLWRLRHDSAVAEWLVDRLTEQQVCDDFWCMTAALGAAAARRMLPRLARVPLDPRTHNPVLIGVLPAYVAEAAQADVSLLADVRHRLIGLPAEPCLAAAHADWMAELPG
jgi:hypothetical protein